MREIKDLCRTPAPRSDESLLGYIVRLTEENGYDRPNWILELAGMKASNLGPTLLLAHSDSSSLSGLGDITGVATETLEAMKYSPVLGGAESRPHRFLNSEVLPKHIFNRSYCKVCPDCIRAKGYCRQTWDLVLVTTCPLHKRLLLSKCPGCGAGIRWARSVLSRCACGCNWEMASKEELPDEELGLSEQIHVLAGLETGRVGCNRSNEDNPMVALDLPHLCSFVLSVAGIIYHLSTALSCSPALFCRRSVGVEEMHRYATKAFGVFEEWPNRFFPFLEWVRSKSNTYGAVSLLENWAPSTCFSMRGTETLG
jgi:hypothetical protein